MSKAITSFLDWELSFRKDADSDTKSKERKKVSRSRVNSLGIPEKDFKEFLDQWKKKNL